MSSAPSPAASLMDFKMCFAIEALINDHHECKGCSLFSHSESTDTFSNQFHLSEGERQDVKLGVSFNSNLLTCCM